MTFEFAFGEFYDLYAKPYDLPMQLAETGWLGGGTPAEKVYWWNEVSVDFVFWRSGADHGGYEDQ